MSRIWNWSGFSFERERTPHLDSTLRQAHPYSLGGDVTTNNVVVYLRVLVALRQFRDLPGFDGDVGRLLGWRPRLIYQLQSRLFKGRERFLARRGERASPATRVTALVDEVSRWRSQPRLAWQITATRLQYYHRCLDAIREILASVPGTILDVTPMTTTNPALPRPPRPDWFRPRARGSRQEEMALRLEVERSLGLGAAEGSLFELPLRPGGHGIPQPEPQPQTQPQQSIAPAIAAADPAVSLVAAGPSFSLPLRQRQDREEEEEQQEQQEQGEQEQQEEEQEENARDGE